MTELKRVAKRKLNTNR